MFIDNFNFISQGCKEKYVTNKSDKLSVTKVVSNNER